MRRPNVVFLFADQWRAQAVGCAGDPNVRTPAVDALSARSVRFGNAVSGCPVCCPYRAALFTGQYPLSHGVVVNDVPLEPTGVTLGEAFAGAGYHTAYIGKWHSYGSPDGAYGRRSTFVPPTHRMGFQTWRGFECSHNYNHSPYHADNDTRVRYWDGYDAAAQTREACDFIARSAGAAQPYLLVVSWGPPHDPYGTAPEQYREQYARAPIRLRPNVPQSHRAQAEEWHRGYYAHIAALDDCLAQVVGALEAAGAADDTLLVLTSDHGDMLRSHGLVQKIAPYDESIRVPFWLSWPGALGRAGSDVDYPIDAPDIMPTLLDLCGIAVPDGVEGRSLARVVRGDGPLEPGVEPAALLAVPISSSFLRAQGMHEYRGLRTPRWTYVRDVRGPWLLFDNAADPYQKRNLCRDQAHAATRDRLDAALWRRLAALGDEFLPGEAYVGRYGVGHYREVQVAFGSAAPPSARG